MYEEFEKETALDIEEEDMKDTIKEKKGYSVNEDGEVVLSTGKRIKLRRKTGAHHMVENRLMAACVPRSSDKDEMGINIGDMVAMGDIRAVVSIEAINGKPVKTPANLGGVYEIMSEFVYDKDIDEWSDFKMAVTPDKEKIEGMSKNLQTRAGSETELD